MTIEADKKIDEIRKTVSDRVQEEADLLGQQSEVEASSVGGVDDPRFILDCRNNNERGDGIMYATKHRGKFVYVKSRDEKAKAWFIWTGNHWEIDKADFHHAAVEDVALLYEREAERIKPELTESHNDLAEANAEVKRLSKLTKKFQKEGAQQQVAECEKEGQQAEISAGIAGARVKRLKDLQKKLYDRVDRLRGLRGAKACIEYAHKIGKNGLFIYGDEVDQQPMLLACNNGVIDLETGELIAGNPDDYLVRYVPVDFTDINQPAPTWEKFIAEIHQEDPELIEFIQRFFGYCIMGADPEQMYAFFIGEGANGKGIMFEILREILGDLSWSINPEMLLESKNTKSPDGPSPAVMSLQGRRLVVASETDEGRKLSGSNMKRYTGSDTLTGRNLFDKYDTNFTPTHTLAIYSNHAPRGLTADFALIRRLLYITYPLRYVDNVVYWQQQEPFNAHLFREKDSDLKKKLQKEKSQILSWLVRGCLKYQHPENGGLKIPASIRANVEEVRLNEDHLQQFLNQVCETDEPTQCVTFSSLYDRFRKWYADTNGDGKTDDRFIPKKIKFGKQLVKKGYVKPNPAKTGGKQYVAGITFEGVTYDDTYFWSEAPNGGAG